MKHAGVHWPENAGGEHPDRETIARMPGMTGAATICSPSARYHYDYLRSVNPGAFVVWRAIPRRGREPAKLGWNAERVADECLNLWVGTDGGQIHHGREWFCPLNELQFEKELGGRFPGYGETAIQLEALRVVLKRRFSQMGHDVGLVYPAWVPMDEGHHLEDWAWGAERWDAIGLHCYGSAAVMRARYDSYRARFPGHLIVVKEWNANREGHDERDALTMWAEVADTDPLFAGATYYIWETNNENEGMLSIWGNATREDLFAHPPVLAPEASVYRVPAWTPSYEHIRDGAIQVADEMGMPRRRLLGLCLGESGFGLQSFDRWASSERSKRMVAAINAQDWRQVEAIFGEVAGKPTNDLSWGPCHQTWYWSDEYPGDRSPNDPHRHNLQEIMEFRARYIEDHGMALRVAAGKIRGDVFDDLWYLCKYNKPSVDPPQNPNRPNYERSLVEADRILGEMAPSPPQEPQEPGMTIYEQFPDPGDTQKLAKCDGVIFHGSRSGRAGNPLDAEYLGTARYEQNNPLGLGWNATVGPGKVAIHFPADRWGHNARAASSRYVAVEIAQPTVSDPLPDSVPTALADYIFDHVWPVWGEVWHFPSHSELEDWGETGQQDGKTDLYPTGDERMNVFRQKVYDRLNARKVGTPPAPEPPAPPSDVDYATLTALAYREDGVVVPALAAALANPDDANLRAQADAVLRWLRENAPRPAA